MSAAYTSELASIVFNGVTFDAVGSMSISSARAPIETTQVGSYNSHFLPGVLTTAIALDIYYNYTNHGAFTDSLVDGTIAAFTFTTTTGSTVTGSALVTGVDVVASMGDIVRGSVSLQVTGQITWAGNASALGGNET
jgi:hypothetical protein